MLARWLLEVFESLVSVVQERPLFGFWYWFFPIINNDSTTFCLGVKSVLQLFGLELNCLGLGSKFSFWVLGLAFQEPKHHFQPSTTTSSNFRHPRSMPQNLILTSIDSSQPRSRLTQSQNLVPFKVDLI